MRSVRGVKSVRLLVTRHGWPVVLVTGIFAVDALLDIVATLADLL